MPVCKAKRDWSVLTKPMNVGEKRLSFDIPNNGEMHMGTKELHERPHTRTQLIPTNAEP